MLPIYDSRSGDCRSPRGAVTCGEKVRFRVYPESWRFPIRGYLVVEFEAIEKTVELEMTHLGPSGDRELFEYTLDLAEAAGDGYIGLCFYHFRFENDGGFFRYGARKGRTGGVAVFCGIDKPNPFQLTVYKDRAVPDWFGSGITYQIFPDRFNRSGDPLHYNTPLADGTTLEERERLGMHWGDSPNPHAERFAGRMQVTNRDFFGGNIPGIIEKLDYLKSLGVTTIYLNPIFEAFSNHRYDTSDYEKIDPLLGSLADFRKLCTEAHARGMRVLLDGVFNHTGSDSVYFNRRGRYPSLGAYQSKDSPYYKWFRFSRWPGRYESWWGIDTLPAVDEEEPSYRDFVCNKVVRRWLKEGADGWRLDVADELPDDFILSISNAARAQKKDAFVLGEVWEDATNKISYDERRRYLLDGGLDAVMGYVFRSAVIKLLRGGDAEVFCDEIADMLENYPPYALKNSMNILGTHDTPRILTLLGVDDAVFEGRKEEHGGVRTEPQRREEAVRLLKIASALQFCFVGSPTIYYGDEVGMEGAEDPFCRRTFPWGHEDQDIQNWYRMLGRARCELDALTHGDVEISAANSCTVVLRRGLHRNDSVVADSQAPSEDNSARFHEVVLAVNTSKSPQTAVVPTRHIAHPAAFYELFDRDDFAAVPYRDYVTGEIVDLATGEVELAPQSARILVKV